MKEVELMELQSRFKELSRSCARLEEQRVEDQRERDDLSRKCAQLKEQLEENQRQLGVIEISLKKHQEAAAVGMSELEEFKVALSELSRKIKRKNQEKRSARDGMHIDGADDNLKPSTSSSAIKGPSKVNGFNFLPWAVKGKRSGSRKPVSGFKKWRLFFYSNQKKESNRSHANHDSVFDDQKKGNGDGDVPIGRIRENNGNPDNNKTSSWRKLSSNMKDGERKRRSSSPRGGSVSQNPSHHKTRRMNISRRDDSSSSAGGSREGNKWGNSSGRGFDEILDAIRGKKHHNKNFTLEGEMLSSLDEDLELRMKAVCALYRHQTSEERSREDALDQNDKGFSRATASKGSQMAKFLLDGNPKGPVKKSVKEFKKKYPNGPEECLKIAHTHSKQLFKIYETKKDPFFRPS